jgi:hypothetical protein
MLVDIIIDKMKSELDWVIKITKSSKTLDQLGISQNCYELWLKKYDQYSNDIVYGYLLAHLKSRYWLTKKNKESLLS